MKTLPQKGEVNHKTVSWTCQAWLAGPPGESVFMPSCFPSLRAKGKIISQLQLNPEKSDCFYLSYPEHTEVCLSLTNSWMCHGSLAHFLRLITKSKFILWSYLMLTSYRQLHCSFFLLIQTLSHLCLLLSLHGFFKGHDLGSSLSPTQHEI